MLHYLPLLLLLLVGSLEGLLKCPGPCTPPLHCRSLGGRILGYCLNHKACCDYESRVVGGCGQRVENAPVVYFQSPGYPASSGGDLLCSFDLLLSPATLGIRVDFVEVSMESIPNSPEDPGGGTAYPLCDSDMFFIRGFQGWSPDPRCGNLSGYSVLVEREEGQGRVSLHMAMSSAAYKWNIRLTQLTNAHYTHSYEMLFNSLPPEVEGVKEAYLAGYPRPPFPLLREQRVLYASDEEAGVPVARVGGGADAEEGGVPWQVSIQSVGESETDLCGQRSNRSSHICGGSILDDRTVLSAAHCFLSSARWAHPSTPISNLKVVVGSTDLCSSSASSHLVSHVTLHVNYVSTDLLNDLAVVHLRTPIPRWTSEVRPIPLPSVPPDFNTSSSPLLLSGWGSKGLEDNATYPATLQMTSDIYLLPPEECKERQGKYLNFLRSPVSPKYRGALEGVLCVRGRRKGVEAGYGDSGGPLVSQGTLVGVVSHMRPDSDDNGTFHVDLFVNVYKFVKWVVLGAVPPLPLE